MMTDERLEGIRYMVATQTPRGEGHFLDAVRELLEEVDRLRPIDAAYQGLVRTEAERLTGVEEAYGLEIETARSRARGAERNRCVGILYAAVGRYPADSHVRVALKLAAQEMLES